MAGKEIVDREIADKQIAEALLQILQLIEGDQFGEVSVFLQNFMTQHADWVDARLQAEIQLVMKQMECRIALKDFAYLRSIALVYKYCEMNYGQNGHMDGDQPGNLLPERGTIWWCWLQGLEQAPDIVKCCYRSLEKLGKKVVVLDETNLREYVTLPEYITEKYQKGAICKAHYTDLVRLEILTQRGGTWIDATTWISGTERILPLLDGEDLFMFRAGNVSEYILLDNWFIHARRRSYILEATRAMLHAYWEKEDDAKHYFIFHFLMTLACGYFPEEYDRIPLYSNEPCHVLQYELQRPFAEKRWKQILDMSDVHKLTYKLEDGQRDGTFWEHLLAQGC